MSQARTKLASVEVDDLLPSKRVVIRVERNDSLADSFLTLIDNNILCACVYSEAAQRVEGLLDMLDVLHVALTLACDGQAVSDLATVLVQTWKDPTHSMPDLRAVLSTENIFKNTKVIDVGNLSTRNPLVVVPPHTNLLYAIEQMVLTKAHRVLVASADLKELHSIVTQSQVIQFVYENAGHFSELWNRTMQELDAYNAWRPPLIVTTAQKAIAAFDLMRQNNVSGVGVVDPSGVLVDQISVRDLRVLALSGFNLDAFYLPITTYLHKVRALSKASSSAATEQLVTFTMSDKFGTLIGKLAAARSHRAFAVDNKGHCIAVAALSDIMKVLCA